MAGSLRVKSTIESSSMRVGSLQSSWPAVVRQSQKVLASAQAYASGATSRCHMSFVIASTTTSGELASYRVAAGSGMGHAAQTLPAPVSAHEGPASTTSGAASLGAGTV